MEEENREQPTMEPTNVSIETNEESVVSEVGSQQDVRQALPERNNFGKFKSAEDLLMAYNNLEAEFTKKCQKLSALEKEKTEQPQIDLEQEFERFLLSNAEAKEFSEEIKSYVQSEGLQRVDKPFETAWAKVVLNHVSSSYGKANDPIVKRYVLSNEEIENKIVENYLNALKEQKSPMLMSSQKGERVSSVTPDTPSSLNEARNLVEKMFS